MTGQIIWWSQTKSHGVISATQNGRNQRFFLLMSRILSAPEKIAAGQQVEFNSSGQIRREGLLPLAESVIVSESSSPNETGKPTETAVSGVNR